MLFQEKDFYKHNHYNKKNLVISSIENNIVETLCPFIFSKYGLFNINNPEDKEFIKTSINFLLSIILYSNKTNERNILC